MARVIKCDRCGRVYDKNSNHWIFVGTGNTRESEFDLCDFCIADFRVFMNPDYNKEVDKNEKEGIK